MQFISTNATLGFVHQILEFKEFIFKLDFILKFKLDFKNVKDCNNI